MKKRVIIVANGQLGRWICGEIHVSDVVIGVDRAAYWLLKQNIHVDVAIGDFDSATAAEVGEIKKKVKDTRQYPPEKDFTDTELAFKVACSLNPKEIFFFGASGTRKDHELAVMGLLELCQKRGIFAVIKDETNEVRLFGRGRTILYKREGYRYVSIVPYTHSIEVTLSGFKYEITKKTIRRGQTIGVSNEFVSGRAIVDVHRGTVLIIQSRD